MSFIAFVPLLPLLGALINALLGRKLGKPVITLVACGTVFVAFGLSLVALMQLQAVHGDAQHISLYNWITIGKFSVNVSFLYDPLAAVMLLVVTGVGFLIHVYAVGYMNHDEGYARFFVYMNLFVFSMLLLVLADNYLLLYAGWELVGLCSYLLIGFWFHKSAARSAAVKAFVVNRVGDFGFALGLFLIWTTFGTFAYADIFKAAPTLFQSGALTVTLITLLLFAGATGKSAQIPLYVWLPDAMEGPTPVSALIHAATMVTAGVYMVARSHVLFELAPSTSNLVAIIGAVTALFAATIALTQTDLKRVLAYSTISQLGYMFLGAGVFAYGAAIFHLMTHAFFKALLFLAAGSVMHAMNDVIDMRKLGALAKPLRITYIVFVIGALALAGFPLTSGFFSKDEILASAFASGNFLLYGLGVLTAGLTAFYIFRAVFLTFHGEPRWLELRHVKKLPDGRLFVEPVKEHGAEVGHEAYGPPHESPRVMWIPLALLAFFALVAGFIGLPAVLGQNQFADFLVPVFGTEHVALDAASEWIVIGISTLAGLVGIAFAYWFYVANKSIPRTLASYYPRVYDVLVHKYYVDELYDALFAKPGRWLATWLADIFDKRVIDGTANGIANLIRLAGRGVDRMEVGYARAYALAMLIGIVIMVATFLIK